MKHVHRQPHVIQIGDQSLDGEGGIKRSAGRIEIKMITVGKIFQQAEVDGGVQGGMLGFIREGIGGGIEETYPFLMEAEQFRTVQQTWLVNQLIAAGQFLCEEAEVCPAVIAEAEFPYVVIEHLFERIVRVQGVATDEVKVAAGEDALMLEESRWKFGPIVGLQDLPFIGDGAEVAQVVAGFPEGIAAMAEERVVIDEFDGFFLEAVVDGVVDAFDPAFADLQDRSAPFLYHEELSAHQVKVVGANQVADARGGMVDGGVTGGGGEGIVVVEDADERSGVLIEAGKPDPPDLLQAFLAVRGEHKQEGAGHSYGLQ